MYQLRTSTFLHVVIFLSLRAGNVFTVVYLSFPFSFLLLFPHFFICCLPRHFSIFHHMDQCLFFHLVNFLNALFHISFSYNVITNFGSVGIKRMGSVAFP